MRQTMLGNMMTQSPCSRCNGKGKIIKTPCPTCSGQGRVQKNKKIRLDIPEGIDNGQYLQKRGFGNVGANGGPYGDLLIGIRIKPHELFRRKGADVFCDMPIDFWKRNPKKRRMRAILNDRVPKTLFFTELCRFFVFLLHCFSSCSIMGTTTK
jgi:DnaJ-class molecular chaperone